MQLDFGRLKGSDGQNCFIKYSAYADGSAMEDFWRPGLCYIGFALLSSKQAPGDNSAYRWSRFTADDALLTSQVKQEPGDSTSDVMSQKAVTDATAAKLNKSGDAMTGALRVGQASVGSAGTVLYTANTNTNGEITDIETVWHNDRFRFVVKRGSSTKLQSAEMQYSTNSGLTWATLFTLDLSGNLTAKGQILENGTRVYSPNNRSGIMDLKRTLLAGENFNDLTETGIYQWERANHSVDSPNAPTQSNAYGILEVVNAGYFIKQTLTRYGDNAMWVRTRAGTTWIGWVTK